MLVLNPSLVKFGATSWADVTSVQIDRSADKVVVERGDFGPHITLADVPEQRIAVRVTRELLRDDISTPKPSQQAELVLYTSPSASDGLRRRVRVTCVVTGVLHEFVGVRGARQRGAVQIISLIGVSSDGAIDPIVIEDATDGVV